MDGLPIPKVDEIANLVAFFGNGFVFRYAVSRVRPRRNESDLSLIAQSILASVALWVPYEIARLFLNGKWAVAKAYQLPCTTGLLLITSYIAGLIAGRAAWLTVRENTRWLSTFLGAVHSQALPKFLDRSQEKWLRVQLQDGKWYQGIIRYRDEDPERFKDAHIAIGRIYEDGASGVEPLKDVEEMLFCITDVKSMQILTPGHGTDTPRMANHWRERLKYAFKCLFDGDVEVVKKSR